MALHFHHTSTIHGIAPFEIPPELEARAPAEIRGAGRDDVRLLVTTGSDGAATHERFADLPHHLRRGDLIVVNASATIPSSLLATTVGGTEVELSVATRFAEGTCVVEPRRYEGRAGETLSVSGGAAVTLLEPYRSSRRLWKARFDGEGDLVGYLHRFGTPIAYQHMRGEWPIEAYQTVYAAEAGSAEMPSAGRPFTREMLKDLQAKGIGVASIVLHTGVSSPERDEPPAEEQFRVSDETAVRVRHARAGGGRVVAVGTTVVRALETAARDKPRIEPASGWTDLVIAGDERLRVVDGVITGLHEPRSTHLAMLEALAGAEHIDAAYRSALAGRYLWHEFGDSHLILP